MITFSTHHQDSIAKSLMEWHVVIPAEAGIQVFQKHWMPDLVRHDKTGAFYEAATGDVERC